MRRWLGFVAGWALAIALGVFIDREVGFARLLAPWASVPLAVALGVLATQLASYWTRAARIAQLEPRIGLRRSLACTRLVLVHNALNLLLPMRAGEASFPVLMRRWFGVDPARATGLLLWLRVTDLHVLASVALAVTLGLSPGGFTEPLRLAGWLLLAAAAAAPIVVFAAARPLARWCQAHPDRSDTRARRLAERLVSGVPDRAQGAVATLAWTWASWAIKLAGLAWLYAALSGSSPLIGLLAAAGGDLSSVLPLHAPGGFGSYEAGVMALIAPFRAIDATALSAAVNLHLFVLGVALGAALPAAFWRSRDRGRAVL